MLNRSASANVEPLLDSLRRVVAWTDSVETTPLDLELVPGTSESERSRLRALGWLMRELLDEQSPHWRDSFGATASGIDEWLAAGGLEISTDVRDAMSAVVAGGCEAVANLYVSLVGAANRRRLGTFFTPTTEAKWMVERWAQTESAPASVVDVGAGVGLFTREALGKWPSAIVHSVDINPVTLGLLYALVLGHEPRTSNVHPELDDFVVWMDSSFAKTVSPRLILGNPPYTRMQLIPAGEREVLRTAASPLVGARASLSAIMLAVSLRQLEAADGVCLLLPALWLEADYAAGLRKWLWEQTQRRVEVHLFKAGLFEDAQVDAVALIVGRRREEQQPLVFSQAGDGEPSGESQVEVDRGGELPAAWRGLLPDSRPSTASDPTTGTPLRKFAEVQRGLATGRNSFFTLSDEEVERLGLGQHEIHPYFYRVRDFGGALKVTTPLMEQLHRNARRHLLCLPPGATPSKALREYIAAGVQAEFHLARLCQDRREWWDLRSELKVPDVIVGSAASSTFAFIENSANAAITNNMFGLKWLEDIDAQKRAAILRWLRSPAGQDALHSTARTQAGGLRKLEVRGLLDMLIPHAVVAAPNSPVL